MNTTSVKKLITSLTLPLAVGSIAGIFTTRAIPNWYATLNQPSFNPPNWLFGPVWTTLYILMGISLYMVWALPTGKERNIALLAFGVQLVLNFAWSFFFFYFKTIGFALIEILVLWMSIVGMIVLFNKVNKEYSCRQLSVLLY